MNLLDQRRHTINNMPAKSTLRSTLPKHMPPQPKNLLHHSLDPKIPCPWLATEKLRTAIPRWLLYVFTRRSLKQVAQNFWIQNRAPSRKDILWKTISHVLLYVFTRSSWKQVAQNFWKQNLATPMQRHCMNSLPRRITICVYPMSLKQVAQNFPRHNRAPLMYGQLMTAFSCVLLCVFTRFLRSRGPRISEDKFMRMQCTDTWWKAFPRVLLDVFTLFLWSRWPRNSEDKFARHQSQTIDAHHSRAY